MWATRPSNITINDCSFYATDTIAGKERVGQWDLRETAGDYLGQYDFQGKSVLELGPASGFLTFAMESRGAEVTVIDVDLTDPSKSWNFVPNYGVDKEAQAKERVHHLSKMKNAFWLAHKERNSKARAWYGEVLELPADFGRFDVGLLASVLTHCRDICGIMSSMSDHVSKTMIVTERHFPTMPKLPLCHLEPNTGSVIFDTWWRFTPEFFTRYLAVLGFTKSVVTFHEHRSNRRDMNIPMFTVVAERQ